MGMDEVRIAHAWDRMGPPTGKNVRKSCSLIPESLTLIRKIIVKYWDNIMGELGNTALKIIVLLECTF